MTGDRSSAHSGAVTQEIVRLLQLRDLARERLPLAEIGRSIRKVDVRSELD